MRPAGAAIASLCLFVLALGLAPTAAAQCVGGTITAEITDDPGFEGLYKYTIDVDWDLGRFDLSHLDIFLQLENCECICDESFVQFRMPSGISTGSGGNGVCTLEYEGEYVCMGDPSIPAQMNGPAVKFEPDGGATCEPGVSGTGSFFFYSPMPPSPFTVFVDGLAIKHGQQVCYGDLQGVIPTCDCALPAGPSTWGRVKGFYR